MVKNIKIAIIRFVLKKYKNIDCFYLTKNNTKKFIKWLNIVNKEECEETNRNCEIINYFDNCIFVKFPIIEEYYIGNGKYEYQKHLKTEYAEFDMWYVYDKNIFHRIESYYENHFNKKYLRF